MTQLLISVKNIEETQLALDAGVDIIDLKDPTNGALGALDLNTSTAIIKLVNGNKPVSATVGEHHHNLQVLVLAIKQRATIKVDIIKIAVSDLFYQVDFVDEILNLCQTGIKIVAVFFADDAIDFSLLPKLQQAGFYGAMLDTRAKQHDLFSLQNKQVLHHFTLCCQGHQLICGLAGSLKPQYIEALLEINPTYIGFRGGVCNNLDRKSGLNKAKLSFVQNMLRIGNKNNTNPHLILGLALHS